VYFNDLSKESIALLNKNLARLKAEKYFVTNLDFSACLNRCVTKFDIIFIDPPYKLEAGREALEIIGKKGLLEGIAVYERDRAFEGQVDGLELFDERKYGKTYLSFFKKS
jgi:16S rRNA (guanine966-N2)-methyltransferase